MLLPFTLRPSLARRTEVYVAPPAASSLEDAPACRFRRCPGPGCRALDAMAEGQAAEAPKAEQAPTEAQPQDSKKSFGGPRKRLMWGRVFLGQVVDWKGKYGWIQPAEPILHFKANLRQGRIFVSRTDLVVRRACSGKHAHRTEAAPHRICQRRRSGPGRSLSHCARPTSFKLDEIAREQKSCKKGIDYAQTCPIGWKYVAWLTLARQ
ncbi:hypothetical protein AK812_SmicGene30408 [Symbiodinium microadriaticum]|uniref:Uncharacterized protein n=1 Tax=Symbiodinium microadriaticum TaxID=2951 RepID=A0A1Q9CZC4_SYMMI|nr:hypothetical protein AK812_SmicGene30408 [Symbiodinium microadriaticum]